VSADIVQVVEALGGRPIPVLAATADALGKLRREMEKISARDISRVVLRDPLLTLEVLRYAQQRRSARQSADITTVEHAVMMHGIESFMGQFSAVTTLEDTLASDPMALQGALHVVSRSQHAAAFARSIAAQRHDVESDEVTIGALLHDLAELLLWFHAPRDELHVQCLVNEAAGLRSASAQRLVFGFTHGELQLALAEAWHLPNLLVRLMDDEHADHPRVVNVALAAALARHLSHGWHDPALPDDYTRLQKILNLTPDGAYRLVRQAGLSASRQWKSTGVRPVGTWLPMEEGRVLAEYATLPFPKAPDPTMFKSTMGRVQAALPAVDADALIAGTLFGLHFGLGLERVCYLDVAPDAASLQVRFCVRTNAAMEPSLRGHRFPLSGTDLFSRLLPRMQGVWAGGENRPKLTALLLPEHREMLGEGDFLVMSFHLNGKPAGLLVADRGSAGGRIPESLYAPFKAASMALAHRLTTGSAHG